MALTDPTAGEAALVQLLSGPSLEPALAQLLRPLRLRLLQWRHLRTHHRPGGGASGVYRLHTGARDGRELVLYAVATAAAPAGPGVRTVRVHRTDLRLWLHPADPVLQGLAWATNAAAVGEALFNGQVPRLEPVSYRPMRRAVLRAVLPERTCYLKVLQPRAAVLLHRRHTLLAAAGLPVPAASAPGAPGVLVLEALRGSPLVRPLLDGSADAFAPDQLPALLDALPAQVLELPARSSWSDRVRDYAGPAAVVLPEHRNRIRNLAEEAAVAAERADPGPLVPVHGDLHPANLLVAAGGEPGAPARLEIAGLLDLDGVGPGRRVDDLACFLGHAAVIAALNPHRPAAAAQVDRFRTAYGQLVDPRALAARSAAVALTLVAGARGRSFRTRQEEALLRLEAAEALLRS